jgi:hypothetical protein
MEVFLKVLKNALMITSFVLLAAMATDNATFMAIGLSAAVILLGVYFFLWQKERTEKTNLRNRLSPEKLRLEYNDLCTANTLQIIQEFQATGKAVDATKVAEMATNRTSNMLMKKYGFKLHEMAQVINGIHQNG